MKHGLSYMYINSCNALVLFFDHCSPASSLGNDNWCSHWGSNITAMYVLQYRKDYKRPDKYLAKMLPFMEEDKIVRSCDFMGFLIS